MKSEEERENLENRQVRSSREKQPEEELRRGRSRRKGSHLASAGQKAGTERGKKEDFQAGGEPGAQTRKRILYAAGVVLLIAAAACGGAYCFMGQTYKTRFFPHTEINGMDVSGQTVEQVEQRITEEISGYILTLEERGTEAVSTGAEEQLSGVQVDLHPEFDGSLEALLEEQNPLAWGAHLFEKKQYTIETMVAFDEKKLEEAVDGLDCMDPEKTQAPRDARRSDYIEGVGYQIEEEIYGNTPDRNLLLPAISNGILNLQSRLSLEDLGVYEKPQITAEDESLQAQTDAWNKIVGVVVTYRFGSSSQVLDGGTTHQWLSSDSQGNPVIQEGKAADFVAALAKQYNTAYEKKKLKTSYGQEVTISGGPYGWKINQSAETKELLAILQSGESQEREPVYSLTGASHDGNDYGSTYVEINLTAQHLFFYKDGKLVVESDFVSGDEAKGYSTPAGAYPLTYKERNATLKGENYATPVSYWMPFNGNIGMHDAPWRSSFGGTIYKRNGSHGCVNLPPSVAKTIYENISAGMPVLCYYLSGTEQTSSKTTETTAAPTTAAPTTAAPTTAAPTAETPTTAAPTAETPTTAAPAAEAPTTAASPTAAPTAGQQGPEAGGGPGGQASEEPGKAAEAPGSGPAGPGAVQAVPGNQAGPGTGGAVSAPGM